jgi:hypothetical protein
MAGDGQVHEGAALAEVEFDFATIYDLSGPALGRGRPAWRHARGRDPVARAGRLGLDGFPAGLGLLAEDFPDGSLKAMR